MPWAAESLLNFSRDKVSRITTQRPKALPCLGLPLTVSLLSAFGAFSGHTSQSVPHAGGLLLVLLTHQMAGLTGLEPHDPQLSPTGTEDNRAAGKLTSWTGHCFLGAEII